MLALMNRSDTLIIVVHEIYGINEHISKVCRELSSLGCDILCPDLYQRGQPFAYDEQAAAYSYFTSQVGFTKAALQIQDLLCTHRNTYRKILILGYSIGATTAWLCSESGLCDGIVGYYGSRIRDFLHIRPACPVLLFYPRQEEAFEVGELIERLQHIPFLDVKQMDGQHGFADPCSNHFNKISAQEVWGHTLDFINNITG